MHRLRANAGRDISTARSSAPSRTLRHEWTLRPPCDLQHERTLHRGRRPSLVGMTEGRSVGIQGCPNGHRLAEGERAEPFVAADGRKGWACPTCGAVMHLPALDPTDAPSERG
jgi:hypothetical protein